jgi:hypothetical protein
MMFCAGTWSQSRLLLRGSRLYDSGYEVYGTAQGVSGVAVGRGAPRGGEGRLSQCGEP